MVFLFFSFTMSILWIWLTANILIDLLDLFGILFKIPPILLGLTVLAWGNSVGDLMTNLSIAKKGFGEMAITGCIAGPLFNTLFGFGITTLKVNLEANDG
jgi:sodium/potassium/calcium exchanger 6